MSRGRGARPVLAVARSSATSRRRSSPPARARAAGGRRSTARGASVLPDGLAGADDGAVHAVRDLVGERDRPRRRTRRRPGRRGTRRGTGRRRCSRRTSRARRAARASGGPRRRRRRCRPGRPSASTRNTSASTAGLSGDRLTTQFEMTTSTEPSASGRSSMVPLRNSTLVAPALAAFARASVEHLVGHVDAVREAGRADPAGRQQHVDAAARAEVEHALPRAQLRDRQRVAAAERRGDRLDGEARDARSRRRAPAPNLSSTSRRGPQRPAATPVGPWSAPPPARSAGGPAPGRRP